MATKSPSIVHYEEKNISWEADLSLCKSCGLCIEKCPVKCLSFDRANNQFLGMPGVKCQISKCIACHTCETVCPDCAIEVKIEKK